MDKDFRSPETELGDTAGARSILSFDYQSACTAILAMHLFGAPPIYERVFCEHQDDILLKLTDGKFVAVQVKTRGSNRELVKSKDSDVLSTLANFVNLEKSYPMSFVEYQLITNCDFWRAAKTGSNLPHMLQRVSAVEDLSELPQKGPFFEVVEELMKYAENERQLLSVLRKIRPRTFPEFSSIELHLALLLRKTFNLGTRSYDLVNRAARHIINEMFLRGKIHKECLLRTHEIVFENRTDDLEKAVIEGKTVTAEAIQIMIGNAIGSQVALRPRDFTRTSTISPGLNVMEQKLVRGQLSIENVDYLMDCKHNAWSYFIEGIDREDEGITDTYNDAWMIVRGACLEAHDGVYKAEHPFGRNMLDEIRKRLRNLNVIGLENVDKEYVLLLGITGILTEDCEIWWSEKFPIEEMV